MSSIRRHIDHGKYLNWFVLVLVVAVGATSTFFSMPTVASEFDMLNLLEHAQQAHILIASCSVLILGGLVLQRRDLTRLWSRYEEAQRDLRQHGEKHASRVYALLNVSKMMVTQNDLPSVFDGVVKTCVEVFGCDQASLMMYDPAEKMLDVRAVAGKSIPEGMLGTRQPLGGGVAGWVALKREPLLLGPDGLSKALPGLEFKRRDGAAMVVPIILRDELVGVINVSTHSNRLQFDAQDMRALQVFAQNVGTAIRHTEQAEWMRATIRKLQSNRERSGAQSG